MAGTRTQQFIEIDQIREGVIVLKDTSLRGIFLVSSLNFALKSEEEQNAILYQFQNFLNSLDFSCQIVVQSRRLNITGYLDTLKDLAEKQQNELLRNQTVGYTQFIEEMIKGGSIMKKTFLVVVPFYVSSLESKDQKKSSASQEDVTLTETVFQRHKFQLWQRMEFVALGLKRCGLQAVPLITPEIIEIFWALHHPKEAEFGYYPELPPEMIQ